MKFDELNESNYTMFAIKHYKNSGDLNVHLLLNHFIILYNVFGEATTALLFFKIDKDLWGVLKTFIVYLERIPEYPKTALHDIPVDAKCLEILNDL